MIKKKLVTAAVGAALFVSAAAGSAAVLTIDLGKEFSGASDPSGTAPWLRATFTDVVGGGVELTLTSLLQNSNEFVSEWSFNLAPTLDPDDLVFGSPTGSTWVAPTISTGANDFKADGDGFYDILFEFNTAGGAGERFTQGDTLTVLISGITGLDVEDFRFYDSGGGKGAFMSAAHVQGIPTGKSGWIGGNDGSVPPDEIPEPGVLFLMGAGLLGLGMAHRRKSV